MKKMEYVFSIEDAERFAQEQGIRARLKGSELIFHKCPYCGVTSKDKEKFAINTKTGQFHCFRASCGAKGNMLTLAKDFDFSLNKDVDEYYRPRRHYRVFKSDKSIESTDLAIEYMDSRDILSEVVKKYQLTTTKDGNIVFPFIDENNQIQFIKYRNPAPKEGQNKEWCESGCKPILFGMAQCNLENKTLVITEGQIDSLSVAQAGIENAVSVPTGAMGFTWVPYCWDWMNNFDKIVVFGDHENGHITLYNEIAARWKYKVWHVKEEDYLDCKDANEILQKYGPDQIRKCVEGAVQLPIPKAKDLSKVEYVNPYDIEKLPVGIKEVDKLLCGGLPFGQVVLLTGKAGDGKSTFASQILLNALENNYKVFAYSGELPGYLFKSWIDYQAAGTTHLVEEWSKWTVDRPKKVNSKIVPRLNDWYRDRFWIYDNTITEDEDEGFIALIEQLINQYGVRVILIDNLMTGLDLEPTMGTDKYEKQSLFMKKLSRIALQYEALILLVAHKRKDTGTTVVNDTVSGSADITNLASIVLSYERGTKEEVGKDQRVLKITKNRLFGKIDTYGYIMNYNQDCKRIYITEEELYRRYSWEGDNGFIEVEVEEPPF